MTRYIDVIITAEMIAECRSAIPEIRVYRTQASQIDTLAGSLGELCFAHWFLADWRLHDLRGTKGRADFLDRIEVKTSAFPFRDTLNLLVREDYAAARKPDVYVQTIIDTPDRHARDVLPGWVCRLSGWAGPEQVDKAPLRDFGQKGGGRGGYRCHYLEIRSLFPMSSFPIASPAKAAQRR